MYETIRPTFRRSVVAGAVMPALLLAACSSDVRDNSSSADLETIESSSPQSSPPSGTAVTETTAPEAIPAIPTGTPFGPAAWAISIPAQVVLLTTHNRIITYSGTTITAFDEDGQEVWTYEAPPPEDEILPQLRLTGPNTLAYLISTEAPGDGITKAVYGWGVKLIDTETGTISHDMTIKGGPGYLPLPSDSGLVFLHENGDTELVTDTGERQTTTLAERGETSTPSYKEFGSIHNTLFWTTKEVSQPDYQTADWSIKSLDLIDYTKFVTSTNTLNLPNPRVDTALVTAESFPTAVGRALVDVTTGSVLAKPDCAPSEQSSLEYSPNLEHATSGPLILRNNRPQCVGGGADDLEVDLSSITDDGTAYGRVLDPEGGAERLITVTPDQQITVTDLPEGAGLPYTIMDGNIAVHYDQATNVMTGNPIV